MLKCSFCPQICSSAQFIFLQQYYAPTIPVPSTRSYGQLIYCMLYNMCQEDDRKSTGVKAACKMMMKLTPRFIS